MKPTTNFATSVVRRRSEAGWRTQAPGRFESPGSPNMPQVPKYVPPIAKYASGPISCTKTHPPPIPPRNHPRCTALLYQIPQIHHTSTSATILGIRPASRLPLKRLVSDESEQYTQEHSPVRPAKTTQSEEDTPISASHAQRYSGRHRDFRPRDWSSEEVVHARASVRPRRPVRREKPATVQTTKKPKRAKFPMQRARCTSARKMQKFSMPNAHAEGTANVADDHGAPGSQQSQTQQSRPSACPPK